ncbi:hypothetical protein HN51_041086, partial [Arachis hypogaea]
MLCIDTFNPSTPFNHSPDYTLAKEFTISQHLKITIFGFDNFGQFFATTLVCQGHTVLVHSHSDHSVRARNLGHNTLFVDVLSVKEFPKKLHLELLSSDFDVLCTHPMFEPQSALDGWTSLPFIFEKVCILYEEHCVSRCEKFLNAFFREGYKMVEMSCEDHDHYAADSQFITHTVGRILEGLMLESMLIITNFFLLDRTTT